MKLFLIIAFGPLLLVIAILMSIYLPQIKMGADKMKDSLQWMTLPITMAAYAHNPYNNPYSTNNRQHAYGGGNVPSSVSSTEAMLFRAARFSR